MDANIVPMISKLNIIKDKMVQIYLFDNDKYPNLINLFNNKIGKKIASVNFYCISFSFNQNNLVPQTSNELNWLYHIGTTENGKSEFTTACALMLQVILPLRVNFIFVTNGEEYSPIERIFRELYPERTIFSCSISKMETYQFIIPEKKPNKKVDTINQSRLVFYKLLYNRYLKSNRYNISHIELYTCMIGDGIDPNDIGNIIKETQTKGIIIIEKKVEVYWIMINVDLLVSLNNQLKLSN